MVNKTKVLRLESIKKLIFYDDKSEKKYNRKYRKFIKKNIRDVQHKNWTELRIEGFEGEILSSNHN